ncbi:hypothetical protein NQ315_013538 [Exocentrus adspersus]|uniref:Uncharacterized protein n=1 Tax=Exocentrus adspersus TaxID=1586481 RepID=A0AAV8VAV4_9CUCU|nr:hypothetical protein NQ315_013538 [Exocentrus adspersus]
MHGRMVLDGACTVIKSSDPLLRMVKDHEKPEDDSHELVLSIINKKSVYGLDNPNDSDSVCVPYSSSNLNRNEVTELNLNSFDDPLNERFDTVVEEVYVDEDQSNISSCLDQSNVPSSSKNYIECSTSSDTVERGQNVASRRRPAVAVRALTSSHLAEKYNTLVEKRLTLTECQLRKTETEIKIANEEHNLKMQILKTKLKIKEDELKLLPK